MITTGSAPAMLSGGMPKPIKADHGPLDGMKPTKKAKATAGDKAAVSQMLAKGKAGTGLDKYTD